MWLFHKIQKKWRQSLISQHFMMVSYFINCKNSLTATKHRTAHGEICQYIVRNKLKETFFVAIQLVWYIYKTIIHLSVGESGGYLPRRFAAR